MTLLLLLMIHIHACMSHDDDGEDRGVVCHKLILGVRSSFLQYLGRHDDVLVCSVVSS
jgi:hypothetical protein